MKLKRILVAAVLGSASIHIPQSAWSQETERWFVVRDATDLTYAFEFVCVGDRTAAQDTVAGLRILDSDSSIHALPERAFKAQQAARLINAAFKELSCAGRTEISQEINDSNEQPGWSEGFDIARADPAIGLPTFDTLKQAPVVAIPPQMVPSKRQVSVSHRTNQAATMSSKPKSRLPLLLLLFVGSRGL
jgi:hypothetical protein